MYVNYGYPAYGATPDQLSQLRNMNVAQPMMQQMPQQATPQPAPTNQGNNSLIWVQGETGAKSYLVAPGNTVMLMDSENTVFYLKTADASGMPLPLRVFDYSERTVQTASSQIPIPEKQIDLTQYVTREEFDAKIKEMIKATGGAENG